MEDNENRKFDRVRGPAAARPRSRRPSSSRSSTASSSRARSPRRSTRPRRRSCSDREPGASRQPRPVGHRDAAGLGDPAGGLHPVLRAARPAGRRRDQGPGRRGGRRPRARPGGDVRRGEPSRGRRRARRRRHRGARCSPRSVADVGPALVALADAVGAAPPELPPAPGPRAARAAGLRADLAPPVDVAGRGRPTGRRCSPRSASRTCAPARPTATRRSISTTCGRGGPTWSSRPRSRIRSGTGTSPSSSRSRPTLLVDGQDLFWWGVRTPAALARLHRGHQLAKLRTRAPADACDPPPLGERAAAASARRRSPRSRRRSCGRRARRRSRRAGPRARRPPARTPRSRRAGWRGWPPCRPPSASTSLGTERDRRVPDPLVLGQHVAGPAPQHGVVDGPLVARSGQSQRADVGLGRLALPPPVGVRGAGEGAGHAGVHHHHLDVVGQRHRLDREVVAVDAQRVARHPRGRGELVHDPAGHAGRRLLGPLPEQGERSGVRLGAEGEGQRELEGGARGEAGTDRQRGGDVAAQPLPGATSATTPAT